MTRANARQKALEKYLWNDKEGWYADYDLKSHKVRNQLTAAALFPLYVNAASSERAAKVAAAAEARLLKPGGLTTTTVNSGQQWDAPNGWAPLQWVAAEGLQKYGQQKIAMEVSWRFLSNVQHTYNSEQKLVEKYDVSSTEQAAAAEVSATGRLWLDQRRHPEDAGSGVSERETV
jgi:alpha,alpha-trehalase